MTLSPTCPVETIPPNPQCEPRGFKARVRIARVADSKVVARLTTGDDGRFRVVLRPGRYRVLARPASSSSLPRCPGAATAAVKTGRFTRVAIDCDSGIR